MWRKHSANVALMAIVALIAGIAVMTLSGENANKEWREVKSRVMPQLIPAANKTLVSLVTKPLSNEIDIGFVIDAGTKYQFIDPDMLKIYGITQEELYDTALDNLDAHSKNINVEVAQAAEKDATARYVIVELDDGYTAVRLLSAGVRRAIARELGSEYIAAIPTRDFLIFWHKDFPLFDAFTKQVKVEYNSEEQYKLTPTLFRVNKYGIQAVEKVKVEE